MYQSIPAQDVLYQNAAQDLHGRFVTTLPPETLSPKTLKAPKPRVSSCLLSVPSGGCSAALHGCMAAGLAKGGVGFRVAGLKFKVDELRKLHPKRNATSLMATLQ